MAADQRLNYVDCLRAIAALMVVALHAGDVARNTFPGARLDGWLFEPVFTLDFGRAGVVLFFAISGFVIPNSLRSRRDLVNFPIRRFFRLYPVYWLSIPVSLYTGWYLAGREPTVEQIAANVTMLQTFLGYVDIEGLYWTLAVELAFYLACYALLAIGLIGNGSVLGGLAMLCGAVWYLLLTATAGPFYQLNPMVQGLLQDRYVEWFAYFSIMFWGAICRQIVDGKATRASVRLAALVGVFWLVLVPATGIYVYLENGHDANVTRWVLMKYGAFSLALYSFVTVVFLVRLRSPVLAYLGTISYSLYLFHPPVMILLAASLVAWAPGWPVTMLTFVGATAVATIGFSMLTYHYVEAPAIALGARACRFVRARRELALKA